jgi:hypothetical protein
MGGIFQKENGGADFGAEDRGFTNPGALGNFESELLNCWGESDFVVSLETCSRVNR